MCSCGGGKEGKDAIREDYVRRLLFCDPTVEWIPASVNYLAVDNWPTGVFAVDIYNFLLESPWFNDNEVRLTQKFPHNKYDSYAVELRISRRTLTVGLSNYDSSLKRRVSRVHAFVQGSPNLVGWVHKILVVARDHLWTAPGAGQVSGRSSSSHEPYVPMGFGNS